MRSVVMLIGFALLCLAIYAWATGSSAWLLGCDAAIGVLSIALGYVGRGGRDQAARDRFAFAPYVFGILLIALWAIGMIVGVQPYLAWWNLGLGVAEATIAIGIELFGVEDRMDQPVT